MDSPVPPTPIKKSLRLRGKSPDKPLPSTPRRGKKPAPTARVLELQLGESTAEATANIIADTTANVTAADDTAANVPADAAADAVAGTSATVAAINPMTDASHVASMSRQHVTFVDNEDNRSLKSVSSRASSKSNASSARRRKIQAELDAWDALAAIDREEEEARIRKRQTILQILDLKKKLVMEEEAEGVNDQMFLEATNVLPTPRAAPPPLFNLTKTPQVAEFRPFTTDAVAPSKLPETTPAAVINNWFERMPDAPPEHPYAATNEIHEMNSRMEKFMARQTMSRDLPQFSGEPEQWFGFISQFEQTTQLCGLSHQENIVRLNKALIGKARDAVIPILNLPDNVPLIMDTLQMLFGRPNQIIKSMIDKTRNLSAINESRPETIIAFANAINNLVATMKNFKSLGHMHNPALMEELLTKLPPTLQLQWCLSKPAAEESLQVFATWMMNIAMAATAMPSSSSSSRSDKSYQNDSRQFKKPVFTAQSKSSRQACPKCRSDDHHVQKCPQFLADSVDTRWDLVSKAKLCFSCLGGSHQTYQCQHRRECGINGCTKPHHTLLHRETVPVQGHSNFCDSGKEVLLRIMPVTLTGPKGKLIVHAMLDEGSTVTMLSNGVAEKLGLDGEKQSLCLQWTNKMIQNEPESKIVTGGISGVDDEAKKFVLRNVRTVASLELPQQSLNVPALKKKWAHLADVPFTSLERAQPSILIGHDNILLTIPRQVRHAGWNDPVASKTWLGWVIHGSTNLRNQVGTVLLHHICNTDETTNDDDTRLTDLVSRSFETESFAALPTEAASTTEACQGLEILKKTVKRVGNQFEAGLLWKNEKIEFSNSKPTALRRLWCMEKKMSRDTNFADLYCQTIQEYLDKGYAYKLTAEQAQIETPKTWYIPHFAVTNINKPGKIRMVFDAAAKTDGVSLNSSLFAGPDLLNDLPAVLWRFRQNKIGFTADVAEMFHRVNIRDEDLDAQRFLWRGKNRSIQPETYVMKAMIFGSTCSPSTAIYVMNRNAEDFAAEFPDVPEAVKRNYYMDDYADSANDEGEAIKKILDMVEVQKRGGFNLRNWICSSANVLAQIPVELRASNWKELQEDSRLPVERVLGLWWDPETDVFTFKLNASKLSTVANAERSWTKRELLQLIASLFDPLGMIAHFLIKARIIFQNVWRHDVKWDDAIPTDQLKLWVKWCTQLPQIATVALPRFYRLPPASSPGPQLHVFADASKEAYTVVAYFRWGEEDAIVSFAYGKSRVAPLKSTTIPRLELTAALLATRIARCIKMEHNYAFMSTTFWSDSRITLAWVRSGGGRFKQYVANRVNEILDTTNAEQWRWVPTAENPADDGTRLNHNADMSPSSRWYNGPNFLRHHFSTWPTESSESLVDEEAQERRPYFVGVVREEPDAILPDLTRCSSWLKLIRATAWAFRFCCNLRCPTKKNLNNLSDFEINWAEKKWIRKVQRESFRDEVEHLWTRNPIPSSSRLYSLLPLLDDENILRVEGRTKYSELLANDTKFPIILDGKHPFTKLLISYYHVAALHQGVETVINNLRLKFWITGMRNAVKFAVRSCQFCKNRKAKPAAPIMAPLPTCRVNSKFIPFDPVGIELFGPIEVKITRRKIEKRYGVLFTCLAIRAVHLEVVTSLSSDSTIMALRRFMNRRTIYPSDIYTDCGTNFRGSNKEIRDAMKELEKWPMDNPFKSKPIKWHFAPPASPHMGGAWERLIRSVKTAMSAALRQRIPSQEVLETVFTEVEYVLNSRPLTEVSVDPKDLRSLTPNDFLRMHSDPVENWNANGTKLNVRKYWRHAQVLADNFWRRWVKEYLPTLTRRQKWHKKTKKIKVGDAVLITDANLPRNTWPMGIVTELYPGPDGEVRVAGVRTSVKNYKRPVIKLAILDLEPGTN